MLAYKLSHWHRDRDVDYLLKSFPTNALFGQRLEEVYHSERLPHDSLHLLGFANQVRTIHGGTHIQATIDGIRRSSNSKTWLQLRNGLTGIVSVMLLAPEYKGPMKWELENPEIRETIEDAVANAIAHL